MALYTGFMAVAFGLAAFSSGMAALAAEPDLAKTLEMRCVAVPTLELTPEAAKEFNVVRNAQRGLLTVTVLRNVGEGKTESQQAQVFAGAINQNNLVSTIPVREVRTEDKVYYLGEFHMTPPDTLRFLVKANTLHGLPLKVEFSRAFGAP